MGGLTGSDLRAPPTYGAMAVLARTWLSNLPRAEWGLAQCRGSCGVAERGPSEGHTRETWACGVRGGAGRGVRTAVPA